MLLPLLVESFTYNDRTDEGSPTPDCRQHSVVDSDWRFEKLRRCRLQGQKDFLLLLLNCALSIERSAVEFVLSACLLLSNAQYLLRLAQLVKTSVTLTYNPEDIPEEGQKRTPLILIVHKPSR